MQLNPPPGFIHSRIELFEKLKTEYDAKIAGNVNGPTNIRRRRGSLYTTRAWGVK